MPWVDIAVVIIMVIIAIIGISKGFLKSLIGLFGTLVTLALAVWLAKPVGDLINSWWGLNEVFAGLIEPTIAGAFDVSSATEFNAFGMLLAAIFGAPVSFPVPAEYITGIAEQLGTLLSTVASAVVLFIIIKIIVWLLSRLFDAITKNRVVNGLDRLLGFVFGLLKGALFVAIVFGVLSVVCASVSVVADWFLPLLESSPISKWAYGYVAEFVNNILLPYFTA